MGDPHTAYPVILVAGSNGKTSTARLISSVLMAHGLRVGTYISPHLEAVEERLALDTESASPDEFAAAVADIQPFVDLFEEREGARLTYFELTTVLAFSYFAANPIDVAVVEVGMGGRLDATNVASAAVAVVTGISLEHTEVLGDTLELIAGEKVAIAEPGGLLVTGRLPEPAGRTVAAYAVDHELEWRRLGVEVNVADAVVAVGGWQVTVEGIYGRYEELMLPLHGRYQTDNLAVALAACETFFGRELSHEAVAIGVRAVSVPGRLEVLGREPLLVLDGGHNPEGVAVAAIALEESFGDRAWVAVVGVMADKDVDGVVDGLSGVVEHVVTTAVDHERAMDPVALAAIVEERLGVTADPVVGVAAAVERALGLAGETGSVLVIGSLYLAGTVRSLVLRSVRSETTWSGEGW